MESIIINRAEAYGIAAGCQTAFVRLPKLADLPAPGTVAFCRAPWAMIHGHLFFKYSPIAESLHNFLGPWESPFLLREDQARYKIQIFEWSLKNFTDITDDEALECGAHSYIQEPGTRRPCNGPCKMVDADYRAGLAYAWDTHHHAPQQRAAANPGICLIKFRLLSGGGN